MKKLEFFTECVVFWHHILLHFISIMSFDLEWMQCIRQNGLNALKPYLGTKRLVIDWESSKI